jgi:glutamate/tyrosine decarboxylase-like PLP-dependent enzyme
MTRPESCLDPVDWSELRVLGHRMMDDALDHLEGVRARPVWTRMPAELRAELRAELPIAPTAPEVVYDEFKRLIQPFSTGNVHPAFMGWVHGGGTPVGMLAELLAGCLNANLGGRDHAPIEVERQVIRWSAELLGLSQTASGLLVTGTSMANFIAVIIARTAALTRSVREKGLGDATLLGYTSAAAHGCIPRAFDMAGLGSSALRHIPIDSDGRMDVAALTVALDQDMAAGVVPFLVVGTAGSVDTGAIDDLTALANLCRDRKIWFHVDAAFGAMAACSPRLAPLLSGIENADSVAFDFHKWAQVPYDAGCVLVRDSVRHMEAFSGSAPYLRRETRGIAGGHPWPCDLGPDLSRGFRALKVWMTLKTYGISALGRVVEECCAIAEHLAERIRREPAFELLAPVTLNIVCFRYVETQGDLDALNAAIVIMLHELGMAAPSTTVIGGRLAIRAAIVNHRTSREDVDTLLDAITHITRSGLNETHSALTSQD